MYCRLYARKTSSLLPDEPFVPEGEHFNKRITKIPCAGKRLRESQRRLDGVVDRKTVFLIIPCFVRGSRAPNWIEKDSECRR
jgi:hypothetical protein